MLDPSNNMDFNISLPSFAVQFQLHFGVYNTNHFVQQNQNNTAPNLKIFAALWNYCNWSLLFSLLIESTVYDHQFKGNLQSH